MTTALTPGGVPYPLSTDKVKDGSLRMKTMVEFLDPAQIEMYRSGSFNVPNALWTAVTAWSGENYRQGSMTSGPAGAIVGKAGRYLCQPFASFANGSAAKRVGIAIGLAGASSNAKNVVVPQSTVAGGTNIQFSSFISLAANATLTIFLYQDSGVTMLASAISLTVTRIP